MKLLASLLLLGGSACAAGTPLPLSNGSFEKGLEGWTAENGGDSVKVLPEAALLGNLGLRVQSSTAKAFSVHSAPLAVTAGKTYAVSFWSGSNGDFGPGAAEVTMLFTDAAGKELPPAKASMGKSPGTTVRGGRFPSNSLLAAAAPEGAVSLAIRISAAGQDAIGPLNFDDFQVVELNGGPKESGQANVLPPPDPAQLQALVEEIAANPHRGKSPPKIVLKLDDLVAVEGKVPGKWLKVAEFAKGRNIKVAFGIIAVRMSEDCPEFVQWVQDQHAAGRIEFWHHGWDHGQRTVDGKRIMEFGGESYEHQKRHMTDANTLAKEKLGFAFVSFCAPFNGIDANTAKVLSEDPDIKVWMYGDPGNTGGKKVLERSAAVGIENPTMSPNYRAFLDGYAHSRGAEYFVLQGHPAAWNDEGWGEFVKIVDFLISQKAEFVFPSDFAPKP